MRFEWNERKNRRNKRKHGIEFQTALLAFEDPHSLSDLDRVVAAEERWQTSAGLVRP